MNITQRLRAARHRSSPPSSPSPPAPTPPAETSIDPDQARVHIMIDGTMIIDLHPPVVRDGPMVTTQMRCPNCRGQLLVDDLDVLARIAQMSCSACGFVYHHRLQGSSH